MISGTRILIIGGAGFIGSALGRKLCADNEVVLADCAGPSGSPAEESGLLKEPAVRLVKLDAADMDALSALGTDFSYIIDAAAILGIHRVVEQSCRTIDVNFFTCRNALRLALRQKYLKKFLAFSSSEVYGQETELAREDMGLKIGPSTEGRWCYAAGKILSEHMVLACCREQGLPGVLIRPFNVFGPYRSGENAVSKMMALALLGRPVVLSGDGEQIRTWCYIDDFVGGTEKALESGQAGEIFNIGNPANEMTIRMLAEMICRITGSDSKIRASGSAEPDVKKRTLSIEKAQKLLGYRPVWKMSEGLFSVAEWMRGLPKERLEKFVR